MNIPQDAGDITLEELQKELNNENFVPMWQMHDATQHVLRCFAYHRPGDVEQICNDDNDWKPLSVPICQMFHEPYRLKPGRFDESFVRASTNFFYWNERKKKINRHTVRGLGLTP